MAKIFNSLYYLYRNRYQQSVYGDASRGVILFVLYLFALFYLHQSENKYIVYLLLLLLLSQTLSLHVDRKDYNLLSKLFRKGNFKLLLFLDYFILNFLLLCVIFLKNKLFFTISILFILILSITKISFNTKFTYLPLSNKDPLWKTYIRKYPLILILFLLSYYIHWEAILHENHNLLLSSYFIIPFVGLIINSERDKIIFIRQSQLSKKRYLINLLEANIFNSLLFVLPHIMIDFISLKIEYLCIFLLIILVVLIALFRYIFFFNSILFSLVSLIVFGALFSLLFYEVSDITILITTLSITGLVFKTAQDSIRKLKTTI